MPTNQSKSTSAQGEDAFALLTADHKAVKTLFKQFEALKEDDDSDDQKEALVEKICNELKVHAQIEEEIFYPALREAIDDTDLLDEADVEHASVKDLVAQLEQMQPADDHYAAKVTVLAEYVDHHVKEEEGEMFTKARKADIDSAVLGEELAARKNELKAELGMDEDTDSPAKPSTRRRKTAAAARK